MRTSFDELTLVKVVKRDVITKNESFVVLSLLKWRFDKQSRLKQFNANSV